MGKKGKVFPYLLPSVGPGADPGVQAVSPQVTVVVCEAACCMEAACKRQHTSDSSLLLILSTPKG